MTTNRWVSILNPRAPGGNMPIYEGDSGEVHGKLAQGGYKAVDEDGVEVIVEVADTWSRILPHDDPRWWDEHGVAWHKDCTCDGVVGTPCPVCNPTPVG